MKFQQKKREGSRPNEKMKFNPYFYVHKIQTHFMKNLLSLFLLLVLLTGCHVGRYFYWNFADIRDHKKFASRPVAASNDVFTFEKKNDNAAFPVKKIGFKGKAVDLEAFLKKSKTVAFAVIKNDTVVYEYYAKKYDEKSVVPSFSMAKSYISLLIGIAVDEGKIKSVDEPITNYLKDLDSATFHPITIRHLLNMRSGIRFNESYFNPFGDVAKLYYGTNLRKQIKSLKVSSTPDLDFNYISINTQLLGFVLEEATGVKMEKYLEEKLWSKMGTQFSATWSIDSKKQQNVKAFSSLNATLYDFAKLGRLMNQGGNWNGKQLVSKDWIEESLTNGAEKNGRHYSYQWWIFDYIGIAKDTVLHNADQSFRLSDKSDKIYLHEKNIGYAAQGILGQFVYFSPKKDLIVVRLGSHSPKANWRRVFNMILSCY
jgi:CubicO group peptidase (beta-lactamase class C family)